MAEQETKSPRSGSRNGDTTKRAQKDVFHSELERVRESMQKEKAKIKAPQEKEFMPNVYNSLRPFFDTKCVERFLDSPRVPKHSYASRWTASTLVDPWQAYRMDATILPEIGHSHSKAQQSPRKQKDENKELRKEGSTRLPPWPVVEIKLGERRKAWNFTDVPRLRRELREKYTSNATEKLKKDYARTKQDFYRMELDKLDEVPGDLNRRNLRLAYHAYLKNTPGSRQALFDCLRKTKDQDKGKNKEAMSDQEEEPEEEEEPAEAQQEQQEEPKPAEAQESTA